MKLKRKMFLMILAVIIFPIIVGVSFTYFNIKSNIQKIEVSKASKQSNIIEKYINSYCDSSKESIQGFTPWSELYDAIKTNDTQWMDDSLPAMAKDNSACEFLVLLDNNFNVIYKSDNVPKEWDTISFNSFQVLNNIKSKNIDSAIYMSDKGTYIVGAGKVVESTDTDFKNGAGYVIIGRTVTSNILEKCKDLFSANISIKFNNNILVSSGDSYSIQNEKLKGDESNDSIKYSNTEMIVSLEKAFLDNDSKQIGVLHVEVTDTSSVDALNKLKTNTIILLILVILLSFIILVWFDKVVLKPILSINTIIREKDLSKTINVSSKDELGILANEFNDFVTLTKNNINSINETSKELQISSSEFMSTSTESCNSIENITKTLSKSFNELKDNESQINSIYDYIDKINGSGIEIMSMLDSIQNENKDINLSANESITSIDSIGSNISLTKEKFKQSLDTINMLSDSLKNISSFVVIIDNISKQTKLLSLNASIEAAKAGDQGRGFAVVAKEITKLSEQTDIAIKDLNSIIKDIKGSINTSNESLQLVQTQIDENIIKSNITKEEIGHILSNILTVSNSLDDISKRIKTQNEFIGNISGNITNMNNSFDKIIENFDDISIEASSQLAISEEISSKAECLNSNIEVLNNVVKNFKGI